VSTIFPKAEKVRIWGSIFVGSSSRPQTGDPTLTKEASIEGRFRFAGKNLTYGRRGFDRTTAWAFNKKCNGRATRSKPCNSRDGNAAGNARRIATLPGAAARAPIKKDCDTRPRGVATKVRTPFRQTSNATLKAASAFGG